MRSNDISGILEQMRNAALAQAMSDAGYTNEKLAETVGVDPKTVWRWINRSTPPRRAGLRSVVSEVLEVDTDQLWPVVPVDPATEHDRSNEIVAAWAYRADVAKHHWWSLFSSATQRIDLMAYAMAFLPEEHPRLAGLLVDKAGAGCDIRVALAHPDSEEVAERDAEEDVAGGMPTRIRTTVHHFRELFGVEGIELRYHRTRCYNSVYRADDQMLVTPHLYAVKGYAAPTLLVRRLEPGGIFDNFAGHFERVWETGEPIASS